MQGPCNPTSAWNKCYAFSLDSPPHSRKTSLEKPSLLSSNTTHLRNTWNYERKAYPPIPKITRSGGGGNGTTHTSYLWAINNPEVKFKAFLWPKVSEINPVIYSHRLTGWMYNYPTARKEGKKEKKRKQKFLFKTKCSPWLTQGRSQGFWCRALSLRLLFAFIICYP